MSQIKITPLVSVQDFGRSSALLEIGGKNVLLDCGLNLPPSGTDNNGDSLLPDFSSFTKFEASRSPIDCVIISHYHLDHSGSLPYLTEMIGYKGPIYLTHQTKTIVPFVWRECHKYLDEQKFFPNFLTPDRISDCLKKVTTIVYSQVIKVDREMTITVVPSSTPLGPDVFQIEVGQQSIFYNGGCNFKPTVPRFPMNHDEPHFSSADESDNRNVVATRAISGYVSEQSDLTFKMNGGMLSVKIGHSIFHRQLNPAEMQLAQSIFNNLQFMDEANEDEFWQRIAYEMTRFYSPLKDDSKLKWKSLFYDSLRPCGQTSRDQTKEPLAIQNGSNDTAAESLDDSFDPVSTGKKRRKAKKLARRAAQKQQYQHQNHQQSSDDLIYFDTPERDSTNVQPMTNHVKVYTINSDVLDDQLLMVKVFSERLKSTHISSEFWPLLRRDLKRKGKSIKSETYLEEYFKKLANIQLELMRTSNNLDCASAKWPLFSLLNDLDLSHFFIDKWDYRNLKGRFLINDQKDGYYSTETKSKVKKSKKQKQKSKNTQGNGHNQSNGYSTETSDHQTETPTKFYTVSPEVLSDQLITVTLFANRLKRSDISPKFWTLLRKDIENSGKSLKPGIELFDYFKSLAEIQLDVMKNADNVITAINRWPLFMMLNDLPMEIFLEDKWAYRRLKPKFS